MAIKKTSKNWKEFLKPNWKKIILTLIFILLSFLYFQMPSRVVTGIHRDEYHGLPLPFYHYLIGFRILPSQEIEYIDSSNFLYPNLLIDLIFWYLISCLMVLIYEEFRKT